MENMSNTSSVREWPWPLPVNSVFLAGLRCTGGVSESTLGWEGLLRLYNLDSLFHYVPLSNHLILILWRCLVTFLNVLYEGQAMFCHNHAKDSWAGTVKHLVTLPCQHFEAIFLLITVRFNFTPFHSLFKDVLF